MADLDVAKHVLTKISAAGFQKASARVVSEAFHELQAENGEINLMRTNFETDVGLSGIRDQKKASLSINKVDVASIDEAAASLLSMAEGATPDAAHDIASHQPEQAFEVGPAEPDYDRMYDRIVEVQDYAAEKYPELNLGAVAITFGNRRSVFLNSNGVQFETRRGLYRVSTSFASKRGKMASSLMYTGYSAFDLDTPIRDAVNVDDLFRQSTEQLETRHIPAKFTGDLLITPNCLGTFLGFLTARISDAPMITGNSVYKDKLGSEVASPLLTVSSCPVSDQIPAGYWVTGDGFAAENSMILDQGKLQTYLLGLYGANKTGLARAKNSGGCYVVDAGETDLDDMVADIGEGILITRFSGGNPNDRGDFSGIAKNSYYIRDGKIQYPIKETTVSGNMVDLLKSIRAVSRERLNFGSGILPYMCATGITAS